MKSRVTASFRRAFDGLGEPVRRQAVRAYQQWKRDPFHPGLQFKRVHPEPPVYSVRIGLGYRALGLREGERIDWFWIGSHAEYDALLRRLG